MDEKMKKVIASINGGAPEELIVYDSNANIIEKDGRLYDTVYDMYEDEFDDYKPITEQEIAAMFGISLEQLIKECGEGVIECMAKPDIEMEIIDKFNEIPHRSFLFTAEEMKELLNE